MKQIGVEAYNSEQVQKLEILKCLLKDYNDGRRKNFQSLAEQRGVMLKWNRKPSKPKK